MANRQNQKRVTSGGTRDSNDVIEGKKRRAGSKRAIRRGGDEAVNGNRDVSSSDTIKRKDEDYQHNVQKLSQELARERFNVTQLKEKQKSDEIKHTREMEREKQKTFEVAEKLATMEQQWKRFSSIE